MFDMKNVSDGISLLSSVLSTVKSVISILPKREKEETFQKLLESEEKLKTAEAQIAKGLGYELCKCTWPPQIMLHAGEEEYGERFRCSACSRTISSDDMPPTGNWRSA